MSNQDPQSYVNCEVRFGKVPVGTTQTKTYPLKNKHKEVVSYCITRNVQTNPIYYVFDINTYEVKVEPDERYLLKISYTPNIPGSKDFDYFTITDSLGHFNRLSFTGESAGPLVQTSIRNLNFFDTPKRKMVKKVFTLTNTSNVTAIYQFDCVDEEQGVFKVEPTKGTLKAYEHQYITVTFKPKNSRIYSRQLCCFILYHEPILLNLCGVCTNIGLSDTDTLVFRHYPLPFEDTVGFKGYFSDSVNIKYVPPPVSLTTNYLDFGRIMPESLCQILTTSFTNHLASEVEVEWENVEEFNVYPEQLKIPPKQSALYECRFRPKDSCKLSGGIVNGHVAWSISDHESQVGFNVPIPISLRLIGHSFPKNQTWIPSITISPQNVILPLSMPTIPSWTTFMIRAHGHLPVLYKLLPPSKTHFIIKPMVGLIREYQIVAVQLETNSYDSRSYIEQWSIELNGQVHSHVQIYVKAHTDVPRVQVANSKNCIRLDPMHPGTEGSVYIPIKNISYSKLQYEFHLANSFSVDPRKGILAANEEIFVNASYTSKLHESGIRRHEGVCSLQCIILDDIFIGETIDIPVTVISETVYTELCALPQNYQCGEVESGTVINTCFYLYNFGMATIHFKLLHNHDLEDVTINPVTAKCGSKEKLMVKVEFKLKTVGPNSLIISYRNRRNKYTDELTSEGDTNIFRIDYDCIIPTFQILELLEHNYHLLGNRNLWELLKIDEINAALQETNPGEIKRVDLCVPEYEISSDLFYVVFAIKNISNLFTNFVLTRRQVCDCKQKESNESFTFRIKTFDCIHKEMFTMEMTSSIMPKNAMQPLFFKMKYLLPDKNILSYKMQLSHNRTIILNVAIHGIPQDSRVLSVHGENFTLNMGFVYIGLREPPVYAYWLYNNTKNPISFKVDDVEMVRLCNVDGFPVMKCLNCVGLIQSHSSAPLLFKFWPIEVKPYDLLEKLLPGLDRVNVLALNVFDVSPTIIGGIFRNELGILHVSVQLGDRERLLTIEGYGTDRKNKFDFKKLKSLVTKPLRNHMISMSINQLILEPLLVSNSMERMFFITNSNKTATMQYSWRRCFIDGLVNIEPAKTSGTLKPQESHPVLIKITSLSEPCRINILLCLEFVDLDELTQHQAKLTHKRKSSVTDFTIAEVEEKVESKMSILEEFKEPQTFCLALPITVNIVGILDRDNCIYAEDQMKQRPWEGVQADVEKFVDEYFETTKVKEQPIHPQPQAKCEQKKNIDEPVIDKEMTQSVLEYIVSDAVFSDYFKEVLKASEKEPSPFYSQIKFNKRKREKLREKETRKFLTQARRPDVADICEEAILESLQKVFQVEGMKKQNSKSDVLK